MSDEWEVYRSIFDDTAAVISFDLGIASSAPLNGYDKRAYIRIKLQKQREDGLCETSEFEALDAIENALVARAEALELTVFVGRITLGGNRDFIFYTADGSAFEAAMEAAMERFYTYAFETGYAFEPNWDTYFGFIYPSPLEWQQIMNRRVIDVLLKNSDRIDLPRQIDHLSIFKDPSKCQAFAEFVVRQGYALAENTPLIDQGEYRLEYYKVGKPIEIDGIVIPLCQATIEHDGEYDGWGCINVTDAPN